LFNIYLKTDDEYILLLPFAMAVKYKEVATKLYAAAGKD
jgi:hypothetical protein